MLTTLAADLGQALLVLRRRPVMLLVPALAMGIGIGASTAIYMPCAPRSSPRCPTPSPSASRALPSLAWPRSSVSSATSG